MTWIVGERVRIICRGRSFDGVVHLLTAAGKPGAVGGFEGILGGFVNWCPILWVGEHAQTMSGIPVEVIHSPAGEPPQ